MTSASTHVAVIVLNWNGWSDTIGCAESVLRSSHRDLSITICDNASRDDSIQRLRAWGETLASNFPGYSFTDRSRDAAVPTATCISLRGTVTLLQNGVNGGYAAGNNVGIRAVLTDPSVDAVWILNNDVVVDSGALSSALDVLASDREIGLVGSTLRYMEQSDRIQCQGGGRFDPRKGIAETIGQGRPYSDPLPTDEVVGSLDFVNGAAVLASRRLLEKVGLMAEDYFLYWEELDWAFRASSSFKLSYAPNALVLHKVGAAIGTNDDGEGSDLSEYYYNRNRVRFCLRHSRVSLPYVYLQLWWNVAQAIVRRRPHRAALLAKAIVGLPGPKPS